MKPTFPSPSPTYDRGNEAAFRREVETFLVRELAGISTGGTESGDSGNIDGGSPETVYLPIQVVDGGGV